MNETRQSLTDKVAALEQQVVGTIHDATSAVHETVSTVKTAFKDTVGAVTGSVSTVSQGVKDAFDIRSHIRANPWPIIAGAALSGFVTGYVSKPQGHRASAAFARSMGHQEKSWAEPRTHTPGGGMLDEFTQRIQQELKSLAENALTVLSASLKQSLNSGVQNLVGNVMAATRSNSDDSNDVGQRNGFANGHTQSVP